MKIRHGFVSNSSSSSFVLRGIRIKKSRLASLLNMEVPTEEGEDDGSFEQELKKRKIKLDVETTRCFFDGETTKDLLIGKKLKECEDGEVAEYPDDLVKDASITEEMIAMGMLESECDQLSYFFQYVSNDNY